MKRKGVFFGILLATILVLVASVTMAEDAGKMVTVPAEKARVYITDSHSWEVGSGGGGVDGSFGTAGSGGARPQTAEIVKTFGERCPDVLTNNIRQKADYIVVLDHEGGKSWMVHRNKIAVFQRISGDSVVSKSTYSLGASVQEACNAIRADWAKNSAVIRQAQEEEAPMRMRPMVSGSMAPGPPGPLMPLATRMNMTRVTVNSAPDGADIAVDGSFVGNAPSTVTLTEGDHTITVTRNGFKTWERKIKAMGGMVRLNAELEPQQDAAK
jgi:hypothetical protein